MDPHFLFVASGIAVWFWLAWRAALLLCELPNRLRWALWGNRQAKVTRKMTESGPMVVCADCASVRSAQNPRLRFHRALRHPLGLCQLLLGLLSLRRTALSPSLGLGLRPVRRRCHIPVQNCHSANVIYVGIKEIRERTWWRSSVALRNELGAALHYSYSGWALIFPLRPLA
jgi:hypothetical protein